MSVHPSATSYHQHCVHLSHLFCHLIILFGFECNFIKLTFNSDIPEHEANPSIWNSSKNVQQRIVIHHFIIFSHHVIGGYIYIIYKHILVVKTNRIVFSCGSNFLLNRRTTSKGWPLLITSSPEYTLSNLCVLCSLAFCLLSVSTNSTFTCLSLL